ncbi:lipase-like protein [Trypanosoma brucei equiperdum]|uniref:Lipase-like protein n=1 Tax=Trypanosoma brucei equiperdum TaxID=630700 RepID=A0A3L6LEB7_9TRYP|nr:lipase-like protein [Trypanosoma brucei equiperdum]
MQMMGRATMHLRSAASSLVSRARLIPSSFLWPCLILTKESLHVGVIAYRTFIHSRVRLVLRTAVGVPIASVSLYLSYALFAWYPEPTAAVSTDSVADRPLLRCTSDLLEFGRNCAGRYHRIESNSTAGMTGWGRKLPESERNEVVGDVLYILRCIEAIRGTFEERQLVTPRADHGAACPAEELLRIVLAISLDQEWFDIVEAAREMFEQVVRDRPVPAQANVTSAIADLCALSYELEHCTDSSEVTVTQRQRVARAVDSFRPEKSVRELCTIAAEIAVLPLVDLDETTRCLMLTRSSPGYRPQLIITFIGTNSWRSWLTNLRYWPRAPPAGLFGTQLRVHAGFLEMLQSIHFAEAAEDFDQIILIGHSMGGALAQLAGVCLANGKSSRRVTVLTVASPRVFAVRHGTLWPLRSWLSGTELTKNEKVVIAGAEEGREIDDEKNQHVQYSDCEADVSRALPENYRHIRVFMYADVVPKLPPVFLGYHHVGTPLPLHTGCPTRKSFVGWGLWSQCFHSAEMYKAVLERPVVAQRQRYYKSLS